MRHYERAYIAGFFDGEGCVYKRSTGGGYRIQISQNEREVLDWIQEKLGYGKVYGPYGESGQYTLIIGRMKYIRDFIEVVRPYCHVKGTALDVIQ